MKREENKKEMLALWQERLSACKSAYSAQLEAMGEREALYQGTREIDGAPGRDRRKSKAASVVRNVVAELIEAKIDSNIPQPKVTARRKGQEHLAKLIEDVLRNELDRLPMEMLNDQDERTTPIQGADFFLVEWDSRRHTHSTTGELSVTLLHPKQVLPQKGVLDLEEMDYIIVQASQTREGVFRRFQVRLPDDGRDDAAGQQGEAVVLNTGYFRNREGGIGVFRWVGDTVAEYLEDCQARRLRCCTRCGKPGDQACSCGGTEFEDKLAEREYPIMGRGAIPYYKPDRYPVIMRKNVSVFGQFLGDSDVDKVRHQQDEIKKTATRIQEKLDMGGSVLGLARTARIELTDAQMRVVRFDSPQEEAMTKVLDLQADTGQDMAYLENTYQAARQLLGVTDSFQGRRDETATSGRAKEFAAAQTAGRLESRRVMKDAAYSALFERMFQFLLAYADEPRPVVRKNTRGETEYAVFNRYDFLARDAAGEWYWNDEFLFSVDTSAPLAANREAMWQETRISLREGAFGDPNDLRTLILFWGKMDDLHYPGAKDTKDQLQQILQEGREPYALPGVPE